MQSAFVFHGVIFSVLPMSSCSNGASSFHNNGMEGEVVGTKPSGCVRKLPIKKKKSYSISISISLVKIPL